ncbi:MAG: ATP-dependent helicase HrpB [bacterium]|nr:ATP-dependent helicase HrpB [bacterium]
MSRLPQYPVQEVLPELRRRLSESGGAAVLEAPPGAGKSTVVPLHLLQAPEVIPAGGRILMLEPRRLAARSVAARMAELLGERVGETVGYRVRFESRVSKRTRIEVVTEGILTRRIQTDPELSGVALVVFDEFHERNLHGDLALALCLEARDALREDLRLLVMSATLEGTAAGASELLGRGTAGAVDSGSQNVQQSRGRPAPILTSAGRMYPVEIRHLRDAAIPDGQLYPAAIARFVSEVILDVLRGRQKTIEIKNASSGESGGDLLVFLPGAGEIRRVERALSETRSPEVADALVLPLYGELGRDAQAAALRPDSRGRRKIILATPIAETSLTIEGVRVVIDSGLRRAPRYDAATGLSRLELVRISRASADQRAGRAGRLGPGRALRLWSEHDHDRLDARTRPEILEADLAPLLLELTAWGVAVAPERPVPLPFLDAPPPAHLRRAGGLLVSLGALEIVPDQAAANSGGESAPAVFRITDVGREMVRLPVHPRLARMLVHAARGEGDATSGGADAHQRGARIALAADLAALLSERDPLRSGPASANDPNLGLRLQALHASRVRSDRGAASGDIGLLGSIDQAARQLRNLAGAPSGKGDHAREDAHNEVGVFSLTPAEIQKRWQEIGALLAIAYPDRVGLARKAQADGRYLLATGQGVLLPLEREVAGRGAHGAPGASDGGSGSFPTSAQQAPAALVALDLGPARGRTFDASAPDEKSEIRLMAPLDPGTIETVFADQLERVRSIVWDAKSERVQDREELRFGALVLASANPNRKHKGAGLSNNANDTNDPKDLNQSSADDERIAEVFLGGLRDILRRSGSAALAASENDRTGFESLRARLEFLRGCEFTEIPGLAPGDSLPDFSEEFLIETPGAWLRDFIQGVRSTAELRKSLRLVDVVHSRLPYATLSWLDEAAPTHITVPSGSRIALEYGEGEAVLAVKLQELFGWRETPTVAAGQVPVTLHLLSPARRPIQVTRDLAGFWERTYTDVKKELKGRYPKHPWPDDPFDPKTAIATRHTKKRAGQ